MHRLLLVIIVAVSTFSSHALGVTFEPISFDDLKSLLPSSNVRNRLVNFYNTDLIKLPLDHLPRLRAKDVGTLNILWFEKGVTIAVTSKNRPQGRSITIENDMENPREMPKLFLFKYADGTQMIAIYEHGQEDSAARIYLKKGGIFLNIQSEDDKSAFVYASRGINRRPRRLIGCSKALST